jgi:hypothetical protein
MAKAVVGKKKAGHKPKEAFQNAKKKVSTPQSAADRPDLPSF